MKNSVLGAALIASLCVSLLASISMSEDLTIGAKEAQKYIGERKTVCGDVVSAAYLVRSKGRPTFLNLDQPYPRQIFTVVIWGSDRTKFKYSPEIFFKGKKICVTGVITSYRNIPEIVVHDPEQIKIATP